MLAPWKKSYEKPKQYIKKAETLITLPTKICRVKAMIFPVIMYGCESWTIKKAEHQRIDPFELWCWRRLWRVKESKPVNTKGDQSWIFIGRTDAEAEAPVFWPPDVKSRFTGKDPDAGGQEEKGMTEGEMVGWYHWFNEHEFEQTPEVVKAREAWCAAVHGIRVRHDWATERQQPSGSRLDPCNSADSG